MNPDNRGERTRNTVQLRLQAESALAHLHPASRECLADNQRRAHDIARIYKTRKEDFVCPNLPQNRPPSSHARLLESVFMGRPERREGQGRGRSRWRILKVRARRVIPLYRQVTQQSQHALSRSFEKSWTHAHTYTGRGEGGESGPEEIRLSCPSATGILGENKIRADVGA